jgi:hypothetical protein
MCLSQNMRIIAALSAGPDLQPPRDLDRSTLAAWVGKSAFELTPVFDALMADLKRSTKLFMDETPASVLAPGRKRTKAGYFWALARDDRP